MKSYNIKCLGCGNYLNDDPNSPGFVQKFEENKTKYCKRCFTLKYYGTVIDSKISTKQIEEKLLTLDLKNSYVFVVLDILNLELGLIDSSILKKADRVYFVVNKIDCLPKSFNFELTANKINEIIQRHGFEEYGILYTSINNNSSIKRLFEKLKKIPNNKKIYFVGKTNTGKSSLINKLLVLNKKEPILSTSPFINTTLDFKKVKLNKMEIIDTPGFIDQSNVLNFVDNKLSKVILSKKGMGSKNYFLESKQSVLVEKLAIFNYLEGERNNFTFYLSKELKLLRCKQEKSIANLKNDELLGIKYNVENIEWIEHIFELDINKKHNIHINGLCMISVNAGAKKVSITTPKEIEVILNDSAII